MVPSSSSRNEGRSSPRFGTAKACPDSAWGGRQYAPHSPIVNDHGASTLWGRHHEQNGRPRDSARPDRQVRRVVADASASLPTWSMKLASPARRGSEVRDEADHAPKGDRA